MHEDNELKNKVVQTTRKDSELPIGEISQIDKIIKPYFDAHWKNKLEIAKLQNEYDLKLMEVESKYKNKMLIGIFVAVFFIFGLAFYLFLTNRDDYAMQIIVGIVLVVMTFIAGYGLKIQNRDRLNGEDE